MVHVIILDEQQDKSQFHTLSISQAGIRYSYIVSTLMMFVSLIDVSWLTTSQLKSPLLTGSLVFQRFL